MHRAPADDPVRPSRRPPSDRRPAGAAAVAAAVMGTVLACTLTLATPPVARAAGGSGAAGGAGTGVVGDGGVAWVAAASDPEIDRAFAQARADGKPVLLYWGARWCPPCNQLEATLFNRQDFVERSRAFVAVHIDGDAPGAQKLGSRFKVRGYPTMILFDPQARELTRLPGEVDAPQVLNLLQLGLAGGRPVRDVLQDARAGRPLTTNDWRLLAYYAWSTDEQQLVADADRPALLAALAAAAPAVPSEIATRLWLKSVAAGGGPTAHAADRNAARQRLQALLSDPAASRAQMDVLVNEAGELLNALAPTAGDERRALADRYDTALQRLGADASLSRADQLSSWIARVELRRPPGATGPAATGPLPAGALPTALRDGLRAEVARHDREIRNGYERQAVITTAAYLLSQAGLADDADTLLKSNLEKSHSPYYLMSALASNARQRGDKAAALQWYESAWKASVGPATRLQWGASYVAALVELAPQDSARIERAAADLLAEADPQANAFYERSGRSLQRAGTALRRWSEGRPGERAVVVQRLQQRLEAVCARIDAADPQRATCDSVLKPAPAARNAA